jgi:hypothetical protein
MPEKPTSDDHAGTSPPEPGSSPMPPGADPHDFVRDRNKKPAPEAGESSNDSSRKKTETDGPAPRTRGEPSGTS